jgi:hypothetical protein
VASTVLTPWECSAPEATFERVLLDEYSWVDVARGWLADADEVYPAVRDETRWEQRRSARFDRLTPEPRLTAVWKPGHPVAHPVIAEAHAEMQRRYRVPFEGHALTWFRDGRDSQPFDRARELRWLDETVVGILTLGVARPFLLRRRDVHPTTASVATSPDAPGFVDLRPGPGDLVVMGGRCQARWEHAVPKAFGVADGRISIQWRWTARRGRPEIGLDDLGTRRSRSPIA